MSYASRRKPADRVRIATRSMSDTDKQLEIEKLYARSKEQFPGVEDLTVEELDRLREIVDVVLVDVRNPPEQARCP